MLDPDLEIRGGPVIQTQTFGPQFGPKIRAPPPPPGPSPGSATAGGENTPFIKQLVCFVSPMSFMG